MSSVWWPIPVRPSSWFTADQLEASALYHHPLYRVALLRAMARIVGLVGASLLCRNWLDPSAGWSIRLASSAALVAVAWWLPATASDWWFDQRHEPRFGSPPLPVSQLMVGSMVAGFGVLVLVGVLGGALFLLAERGWWLMVTPLALLAGAWLSWVQQQLSTHSQLSRSIPRSHSATEDRFVEMAQAVGVTGVTFWLMGSAGERGPNALTTGGAGFGGFNPSDRRYRIGVTQELLESPVDLQRLVVGHELGHIRLGHLKQMLLAGAIGLGTVTMSLVMVLQDSSLWSGLAGVDSADPRGLPILVMVIWLVGSLVGLASAWLERAHERQADEVVLKNVGSVAPELLRALHATDRADLDPGRMSKLVSSHPPPAERLHRAVLLSRARCC